MDIFTILFLPRSGRLKWDGRVGAMPLVRLTSLLPFSPRFLAQVSPSAVSGLSPEEAKIRGGLPSSSPLFKGVKEKHAVQLLHRQSYSPLPSCRPQLATASQKDGFVLDDPIIESHLPWSIFGDQQESRGDDREGASLWQRDALTLVP